MADQAAEPTPMQKQQNEGFFFQSVPRLLWYLFYRERKMHATTDSENYIPDSDPPESPLACFLKGKKTSLQQKSAGSLR